MNQKIYILCVEDEADVLDVVVRELSVLEDVFPIETAGSADEAREAMARIEAEGDALGVVFCDHMMPGENGVELLVWMQKHQEWKMSRKVLLTGQAGLDATVKAVNEAGLSHYIAKPWDQDELVKVAREQLSRYVVARKLNPLPYLKHLVMDIVGDTLRANSTSDT
jgi:DNA-binding NtrC family response regulator